MSADHWDSAYQRGETALSWYQDEPSVSLAILDALHAGAGDSVVDVGGGTSRLVDALFARGHRDLTVLDVSRTALEIARQRLGPEASAVNWVAEDVTTWSPGRTFDVWHDRATFHFLTTPSDQELYLQTLNRSVSDDGLVILATFALDGPDQCSNLPVARYDADALTERLGRNFVVEVAMRAPHRTPSGVVQPFTWVAARRFHTNAARP